MAKFKAGDRVRLVVAYDDVRAGTVGTVTEEDCCPYVSFDGYTNGATLDGYPSNSCRPPNEDDLELVSGVRIVTDPLTVLIACGIITEAQADAARALAQVSP